MNRIILRCLSGAALVLSASVADLQAEESSWRDPDQRECSILDMPYFASGGIEGGYVFESDTSFTGWKNVSVAEYSAWRRLFDWENETGGDLECQLRWSGMALSINDSFSTYALNMGTVYAQWSQRFVEGWGMEIDASPGLYSSLDGIGSEDFAIPCGLAFTKAFDPSCSILLGASVYPGFDQTVDPRAGVRFADGENVIFDLAYPETRLILSSSRAFRFTLGARMWLWPEFSTDSDKGERLRYDESRVQSSLEFALSESIGFIVRGGYVFGREISFEKSALDVELVDAPFAAIGLYGRL